MAFVLSALSVGHDWLPRHAARRLLCHNGRQLCHHGRRRLFIVAGAACADTAGIRVFLLAAKTLRQRGGDLVLLRRNVRWSGCWKSSAQVR
jgi:hypothetical protein